MANLIYGITIKGELFSGYERLDNGSFLRLIETTDGELLVMPYNLSIYDTAEERNIAIFKKKKNQLSLIEAATKYNITIEEATNAYENALERFPEKFI